MARVLVVEDDPPIATALSLRLEDEGLEVVSAHTTQAAVRKALNGSIAPDLILMNIGLRGGGMRIVQKIHARQSGPKTPVIYTTASTQPAQRRRALASGALGYFEKPYEARELISRVVQVVKRKRPRGRSPGWRDPGLAF